MSLDGPDRPIGWDPPQLPHGTPDDAVEAFRLCGAEAALGHHWGTFQLTDEPMTEPPQRLRAEWERRGYDRWRAAEFAPSFIGSQMTTPIPRMLNTPVMPNRPLKPKNLYNTGANTKDSAKVMPIDAPIMAMPLERTSSRVTSASKADKAADMAPAPCKARAHANCSNVSAM